MKRSFVLPGLVMMLGWSVMAQDAASVAAKEGAEERYERMTADIQSLQAANQALQTKVSTLEQQLSDLRSAQTQAAGNTGVQDDLKTLAAKIEEVDRKREADKEAISEEIHKSIGEVEKLIGEQTQPRSTPVHARADTDSTAPVSPDKGFVYTIQEGDSLSAIVKEYNKDFKSKGMKTITLNQAMQANPKVEWSRLRVGQKIVIPQPE